MLQQQARFDAFQTCYNRERPHQALGIRQVHERVWLVTFMHYDFGYFDDETRRLEPIENPFRAGVLPMSPE